MKKTEVSDQSKHLRNFHIATGVTLASLVVYLWWLSAGGKRFALLLSVFLLGSLGALLSEHLQLRKAIKSSSSISRSATRIALFSPITGGILSVAFMTILGSGLLRGDLFPAFERLDADFEDINSFLRGFKLCTNQDFIKLCFWSISAGFSERIVTQRFGSLAETSSMARDEAERSEMGT